ncbi:unnamed protein product [Pleuronectes platessa]|uniref:Uncharacterized protein n=1 Tax=Pleuronectes platessa TaxID=8262 RepID=A0A9N7VZG7_PLEPL|nr:unnamed protein product [Pleuronectes platessa]
MTTRVAKLPIANTQVGVLADGTSRISCKGQQVYQFLGLGSFSQYTVVPEISLAKIRGDAPLEKVWLLGCGFSTGYAAAVKTGKFSRAVELRATECVDPRDHSKPIQEVLAEMTDGGVDYALECVGSPAVMVGAGDHYTLQSHQYLVNGERGNEIEKLLMGRTLKGTYFGGLKGVEDLL